MTFFKGVKKGTVQETVPFAFLLPLPLREGIEGRGNYPAEINLVNIDDFVKSRHPGENRGPVFS